MKSTKQLNEENTTNYSCARSLWLTFDLLFIQTINASQHRLQNDITVNCTWGKKIKGKTKGKIYVFYLDRQSKD